MKTFALFIISLLISQAALVAQDRQDDYNFQQTYKEIQRLLEKDTRSLSSEEINRLREYSNLRDDEYGSKYQNNIRDIKSRISVKVKEYDNLQREMEYSRSKEEELGTVKKEFDITKDTLEAVKTENVNLQKTIAELNVKIKGLDRERKKLLKANKDLENKNKETAALLEQSRRTVSNIVNMIGTSKAIREGQADIPREQLDSLNEAECAVANLLKDNYILTLKRLQEDEKFIDTARAFYQANNRLPENINEYVNSGNEIINRLRISNTECTNQNADEINEAIEEFTDTVQVGKESFWSRLGGFLFSVWGLVILGGIVVVVLAYVLGKKTSKKA